MKKIHLLLMLALLTACEKKTVLVVSNPSLDERQEVMAEVTAEQLSFTPAEIGKHILVDENGKEIPYQVLYRGQTDPQAIIFLVDDIRGGMQRRYTWKKGKPANYEALVSAQFVPERKDDFAWENDRAAYRMYGPALANENPSNGVDLWLKCTEKPIVAQFYDDDLHHSRPYHINYGEGLDCYKVAHTLGCGGVAPYIDGQLQVGNHFTHWEILEQGILRVVFRLTYPTHTLTVTCEAGSQLNKAEVVPSPDYLQTPWAAGIYLHEKMDNVTYSRQKGWLAYAEEAVSDGGVKQGRNYCAVVTTRSQEVTVQDNHLLVILPPQKKFTYWFGGGWSQWQYPTDADWFSTTAHSAANLQLPLQVKIQQK